MMSEKNGGKDKKQEVVVKGRVRSEACELYVQQEIKDGLAKGLKPAEIGREVSTWVTKIFETIIPPRTLEQRARRATSVAETKAAPNYLSLDDHPKEPSPIWLGTRFTPQTKHGEAKFLTFYFPPGHFDDYDFVLAHLQEKGKRFKKHPHIDSKRLVVLLKLGLEAEKAKQEKEDLVANI
jgi:hypothetical protein